MLSYGHDLSHEALRSLPAKIISHIISFCFGQCSSTSSKFNSCQCSMWLSLAYTCKMFRTIALEHGNPFQSQSLLTLALRGDHVQKLWNIYTNMPALWITSLHHNHSLFLPESNLFITYTLPPKWSSLVHRSGLSSMPFKM